MSESLSAAAVIDDTPVETPSATEVPAGSIEPTATLSAEAADPNDMSWVPEKYSVKNEAGELDHVATLRKVTEAHSHLEKRMGTGDVPPKDPAEYKIDFGEGVDQEAVAKFVGDEGIQSFIQEAHKKGFTNDQLNFVLNSYVASVPDPETAKAQAKNETITALKQEWKTLDEYKENFAAADRALAKYMGNADADTVNEVLRSPTLVKMLANIGKGLGESKQPAQSALDPKSFEEQKAALLTHPAYMDRNHPEHSIVMERMTNLHNSRFVTKKDAA